MISFTPALPDGVDCPWIRERRTRWWLVVPADLAAVVLVALFGAASTHTLSQVVTPVWQAAVAVVVAGRPPGAFDAVAPTTWRWRCPRDSSS